jgi:hypothetical protein
LNPKINLLLSNLNEQLNFIDLENVEPIKHAEKAIEIIVKSLETLKLIILKTDFKTRTEEILFFKEVKLLANAPKKNLSQFWIQKHIHCVTRARNVFPQAVLHK